MLNAVMWDRTITDISEEVLKVIRHLLKSCLFFQNECWVKRENEDFKVSKGAPYSSGVLELTGLFILSLLG